MKKFQIAVGSGLAKKLKIHAGDRITGKVTRLKDFGAFIEIEPGVEGLIHDADARSLAEFDRALETLDAVTLDITPDPLSNNPVLTELELWMAAILAEIGRAHV